MSAFETIGIEAVVKGAAQYKRDIGDVSQSTGQAKSIFSGLGPVIGIAATALGGFLSFKGITGAIDKTTELGSSVRKLMRETGLSAEDGSRWIHVFEHFGLTGDDASRAIGTFAKNLKGMSDAETGVAPGGKKVADILKSIGIEALTADGKIRPINELIPELADKFKAMPDGLEKTALAMQIFGKSGKDMIPILNQGAVGIQELSDQADKLGLTLSAKNLDAIAKYKLAHKDLDAAMGGLQLQIGLFLMPALTGLVQLFVRALPPVREFVTKGLDLMHQGFEAIVPDFMVAKSVAQALFGILTSEGGILNIIATDLALAFGVPKGSAGLIGFSATLKTLLVALADKAKAFLEVGWEILQNAVLPAVMDIAQGFGTFLSYLQPLIPIVATLLGFGWDIFANVADWLATSGAAADVLKVALLGIMGVVVLNTIAGWIFSLGSFIGTLATIPAKMAEAAAGSKIGKLFGMGGDEDPCAKIQEQVKCIGDTAQGKGTEALGKAGTLGGTVFANALGAELGSFQWGEIATKVGLRLGTALTAAMAAAAGIMEAAIPLIFNPVTLIIGAILISAFLIYKYRHQIMDGLSKIGEIFKDAILPPIGRFFTETLPNAIADFFAPENLGKRLADLFVAALILMFPPTLGVILYIKFHEQVDAFFGKVRDLFVSFLTDTLPGFLADNWKYVVMALFPEAALFFYRDQIIGFGEAAGGYLLSLVTDTLPGFIGDHWKEILFALFPLPMAIIKWHDDIMAFGGTAARALLDFIASLPQKIGDHWKDIFTGIPAAFVFFTTQIGAGLGTALTTFTTWLTNLGGWLTSHFIPWDWIKQAFVDLYHGFVSELGKIFGSGYVTDWVGRLGAWLTANFNPWNWIKASFTSLYNGAAYALTGLVGLVSGLPARLIGALGDLYGKGAAMGAALPRGLWDGISSMAGWLTDKVKHWAEGIYGTVKGGLGKLWPGSPSQAGIDLGVGLGLGIEVGIKRGLPGVSSVVDLLAKQLDSQLGGALHNVSANFQEMFDESGKLNLIATRLLLLLNPALAGTDAVLGFKNTLHSLIDEVHNVGGAFEQEMLPLLDILGQKLDEVEQKTADAHASEQWVANWQNAWDAVATTLETAMANQSAAEAAANSTGLQIGTSLGSAISQGLDVMVKNLGLEGGLGALLDKTRSFVTGLQTELGRLLGLPTQQSAQEQLQLAELNLQKFNLEQQAATEAARREQALADLRAQLSAARADQDEAAVASIQARIDATDKGRGPAETEIGNLDKAIDRITRLGEKRKLENDIIAAHGLVADKTLLTDQAVTKAGEHWVDVIGAQTDAIHSQTGDIWTQYTPAISALEQHWKDVAKAAYDAAQAQIDAAKAAQTALIDAAKAQVDLNNARAGGALSEIAYGLQSNTSEGALGRALNNIGGGALLGQFMTKVAGGQSIPAALATFFGPHGAFSNKFTDLQTQLLAEGIKVQPDYSLVALMTAQASAAASGVDATITTGADTVSALAGGFDATSVGLDAVSTGVTDGTATIGAALNMVDLSVGKMYDSVDSVEGGLLTLINIASQIEAHTADAARLLLNGVNVIGLPGAGPGSGDVPGPVDIGVGPGFGDVPGPISFGPPGIGLAPPGFGVHNVDPRERPGTAEWIAAHPIGGGAPPAATVGLVPGSAAYEKAHYAAVVAAHFGSVQPSVAFQRPLPSGVAAGAGVEISFGSITVSGASLTKDDVRSATYDGTTAAMRAKGLIQ